MVIERIHALQGTSAKPESLADVEVLAEQPAGEYGHASIRLHPGQGVRLAQRVRDLRFALPEDRELPDELMTMRLRESDCGVLRLDHDAGQHDDRAVALGLAALALTERPEAGTGGISIPHRMRASINQRRGAAGAGYATARIRGPYADPRAAQRAQTPLQRRHGIGLVVPGSGNDPSAR